MIYFAHRGASGHAPENTLLAFETALSLGATWIELDVFAVEKEIVVIHDRQLDRTTNGTGDLTGKTITYLRSLDAGKGEKIPFLREVLNTVAGKAGINIELKGTNTAVPVASLIESYISRNIFRKDQFLVSSFNRRELQCFSRLAPAIRTGLNLSGPPLHNAAFAKGLGIYSLHIHKNSVTKTFVEDAHRHGFKVFVFTINHAEALTALISIGVDGIFTNYPELDPMCNTQTGLS